MSLCYRNRREYLFRPFREKSTLDECRAAQCAKELTSQFAMQVVQKDGSLSTKLRVEAHNRLPE